MVWGLANRSALLRALCLLAPLACADGGHGGTAPVGAAGPLELELALHSAAGEERRSFARREAVVLVLRVRNTSDAPQRIELPSSKTHDFAVVRADGGEAWRWSRGRLFAQALTTLELRPGEVREFRATWEPDAGPGGYRATGSLPGPQGATTAPVPFSIE